MTDSDIVRQAADETRWRQLGEGAIRREMEDRLAAHRAVKAIAAVTVRAVAQPYVACDLNTAFNASRPLNTQRVRVTTAAADTAALRRRRLRAGIEARRCRTEGRPLVRDGAAARGCRIVWKKCFQS